MHESEQEYPLHQARQESHGHEDDEHDDDFLARTQPVPQRTHRPLRQREEIAMPELPRNRLKNAVIAGLIAGVLCSIENIIIVFANTANYQQAATFSAAKLPFSLALTLVGVACLTFFIGLLICLFAGFIVGKVAVQRRLGFLAGFIAGIVTYGISFLLNYIPNYPGHLASSSPGNAGAVVGGFFVILLFFLIWGIVAGLVSLFGTWLATRRHPYYIG
ncbi:MAG: hypothetical protein ACR2H5_18895 [Ktedonobacteraceae bacterium]